MASTRALHSSARHGFFSLPSFASKPSGAASTAKGTLQKSGSTYTYREQRIMNYSPKELYAIIADVDSYQSFLPFVASSSVLAAHNITPKGKEKHLPAEKGWLAGGSSGDRWQLEGELQVGAMGFQEGYVSHVEAIKWQSVSATAKDSSIFKHLLTQWNLAPHPTSKMDVAQDRTNVDLYLAYAFVSPFHAAAVSAMWERVSGLMIDGFEKRARQVYPR